MKQIIFKILTSFCLFGFEKEAEVTQSVLSKDSAKSADLAINCRFAKNRLLSYYVFNPRIQASYPWKFSSGLGIGVRKDLGVGFGGIHVFGDYSYLYGSHHFQVGPSLEYIHPRWDVTLNYYLPLSGQSLLDNSIIKSIHQVDGRLFYKTRFAEIGLEPSYSLDSHRFGLVTQLTTSTILGDFSVSAGKNELYGKHAKVGFSFPIYRSGLNRAAFKVRRELGVVHTVQRVKNPVQIDKPAIVDPPKKDNLEEKTTSWWDFFFGWFTPVNDGPLEEECWYNYGFSYPDYSIDDPGIPVDPAPAVIAIASRGSSSSVDSGDYAADVESPPSEDSSGSDSDLASRSDADSSAPLSNSALNAIGENLAAEGVYHISIDAPANMGLAPLSSPDSMASIDSGCQSDSSSGSGEFCIVTPTPEVHSPEK